MSERTVKHDTVVIERNFKASAVRVFAAWADPNAHGRWNVPGDDWEIADYENDFRVGGREKNPSGRGVIRNIPATVSIWTSFRKQVASPPAPCMMAKRVFPPYCAR